jgi:uncharacterized protein YbjT (DUF2867 family)
MRVLVTGATGFVGGHLARRLETEGHDVVAMTRDPGTYRGPGTPVRGDIADAASLCEAVQGCEVAYYLVHSLADADFADRDRAGARAFAAAADGEGVRQIVYLGGLGDDADDLSPHLRSRREVERILLSEAPTTTLRAGIVIGDGGISWEILRQLVDRLPVMLTPRWVETRTQPIALDDALACLLAVGGQHGVIGETFDIGGPRPMTYREMLETLAALTGRRRIILPVPVLSPRLSSHWLNLVTDVDTATARALVDSMTNEVIVHERRIDAVVSEATGTPFLPMTFRLAALNALAARAARLGVATRAHALH